MIHFTRVELSNGLIDFYCCQMSETFWKCDLIDMTFNHTSFIYLPKQYLSVTYRKNKVKSQLTLTGGVISENVKDLSMTLTRRMPPRPDSSAYVTTSVYVRQALRYPPGGEDGGSWTGGVFQRREPCLLPHLLGPTTPRRSGRVWLPVQDVNPEYPLCVSRCGRTAGLPGFTGL